MKSDLFMRILLIQYIIVALACLVERNWARFLYWAGAILLTTGVLMA